MEHILLVPASAYNNTNLKSQSVTKQELPKYQVEQNPSYQIDSLKKETNKKLSAKADNFVDKILSCPRIKLSNSRNWKFDGVETTVLLSHFAQQLRSKNAEVPDIQITSLDAAFTSPTLVLNQIATAKERGSWVPFKI